MKNDWVLLILNGKKPKKIPNANNYCCICATDGAIEFCFENNISLDFYAGDFDSVQNKNQQIEHFYTPDQNKTDFEKILEIILSKGYKKVAVYGASGKEQDHFIGNLAVALQFKKQLKIKFFDDFGTYFFAKKKQRLTVEKDTIISLIPFPKAKSITTKGLQYPLKNETLQLTKRIGTRNKAIENEVLINFAKGNLLIFINKNKNEKN